MASLLPRARALAPSAASASASLARAPIARALSTTSPARAFGKEKDFIMNEVDAGYKFGWDESSSMGYLRLLAMEDLRAFVAKMYTDTEALNGECAGGGGRVSRRYWRDVLWRLDGGWWTPWASGREEWA